MNFRIQTTISALFLQTVIMAQTLSLDSCKQYALQNNKQLKESKLHLQASLQVKKDAFTNYFPQIEGGVFVMKAQKGLIEGEIEEMNLPVYDGNPTNLMTATQFAYMPAMELEMLDYTNAGFVTAIQPIYMGGRIINGNKLASLGVDVNELLVQMNTTEVLQNTENYYWTIVALNAKMKTIDSYEELLNNLLADATVAYEAGLIQKSELLKVKMEQNKVKANKLKLANGISIVKLTLAQHMGVNYADMFTLSDTVVNIDNPLSVYKNPEEALLNRMEYKLLNKKVEAEYLQKKITRGEFMPHFAVGAQALYMDVMDNQATNGIGFATITIPISGWWGGSHKIKEHQIKIDIAKNDLDENSELLKLQMNKTYNDLNESFMQIAVAESSVEQAKEHCSVLEDNYAAGVIGLSDLLESKATLQESQNNLVDAKTTYKIKQTLYLQAISQLK